MQNWPNIPETSVLLIAIFLRLLQFVELRKREKRQPWKTLHLHRLITCKVKSLFVKVTIYDTLRKTVICERNLSRKEVQIQTVERVLKWWNCDETIGSTRLHDNEIYNNHNQIPWFLTLENAAVFLVWFPFTISLVAIESALTRCTKCTRTGSKLLYNKNKTYTI